MEKALGHGLAIPANLWTGEITEILTPQLIHLLTTLHREFAPKRQHLLRLRKERQRLFDQGRVPQYEDPDSPACKDDWQVAPIPADLQKRRVEITGPVGDTKMVINMLSPNTDGVRADTAMLDFEDSMMPKWSNIVNGFCNLLGAARGDLKLITPKKEYKIDPQNMAHPMVRVRGLHLNESNITVDGQPMAAGLFDLAVCYFQTSNIFLNKGMTPKFYIPKCEHFLEARWWNQVFRALEKSMGHPKSTLRCTFLIETLPAAFQVEEILYEIRDHAAGLNVGRWDKIFSDIKVLRRHKDRISADRATIGMNRPWMDNYAKRLIKICHKHGAFAIGGMSAFTPGKDPKVREEQTAKVVEDKQNEFNIGHDGCWVSHPYFITHALSAFTKDNQIERTLEDFPMRPCLLMKGEGTRTLAGLRENIRVGMAYLKGWREGMGCVAWDGKMEDLATLEISRTQVWQWNYHNVVLEEGMVVNNELIAKVFEQELEKIHTELEEFYQDDILRIEKEKFSQAKTAAYALFTEEDLADFLESDSPREESETPKKNLERGYIAQAAC